MIMTYFGLILEIGRQLRNISPIKVFGIIVCNMYVRYIFKERKTFLLFYVNVFFVNASVSVSSINTSPEYALQGVPVSITDITLYNSA